jgi:hypothetical protein
MGKKRYNLTAEDIDNLSNYKNSQDSPLTADDIDNLSSMPSLGKEYSGFDEKVVDRLKSENYNLRPDELTNEGLQNAAASTYGAGEIVARGLGGALTTFGTALGSTAGMIGVGIPTGIIKGIEEGYESGSVVEGIKSGFDGLINNEVSEGFNKLNDAIHEETGRIKSTSEESGSFSEMATPANIYDMFVEGAAFVGSSLVGGGVASKALQVGAKALQNTTKVAKAIKAGNALKYGDMATDFNTSKTFSNLFGLNSKGIAGSIIGRTGEAGIEAYGTGEATRSELDQENQQSIAETGQPKYSEDEIEERVNLSKRITFGFNLALGVVDAAQNAKIFEKFANSKNLAKYTAKSGDDVVANATELGIAKWSKPANLAKTIAFQAGSEAGEELSQFTAGELSTKLAVNNYDDDVLDITTQFATNLLPNMIRDAVYNPEAQMSMLAGGMLGGPMGVYGSKKQYDALVKNVNNLVANLNTQNQTDKEKAGILKNIQILEDKLKTAEPAEADKLQGEIANNKNKYRELVNSQFTDKVINSIQMGKYDEFIDEVKALDSTTKDEINQLGFELTDNETPKSIVEQSIKIAKKVKENYDAVEELYGGAAEPVKRLLTTYTSLADFYDNKIELVNQKLGAKKLELANKTNPITAKEVEVLEKELAGYELNRKVVLDLYQNLRFPKEQAKADKEAKKNAAKTEEQTKKILEETAKKATEDPTQNPPVDTTDTTVNPPVPGDTTATETGTSNLEVEKQKRIDSIKINTNDFTRNNNMPVSPDVITDTNQARKSILGALNGDFSEKRIKEYENLIKKSQTSDKQKILILTELEKLKIELEYDAKSKTKPETKLPFNKGDKVTYNGKSATVLEVKVNKLDEIEFIKLQVEDQKGWTKVLKKNVPAFLKEQESTTDTTSDIESKIADIERDLINIQRGLDNRQDQLQVSIDANDASVGNYAKYGDKVTPIELTKEEQKEVKRQFKFNNDGDLSVSEFNNWRADFSNRVLNRVKNEINSQLIALKATTDKPDTAKTLLQLEEEKITSDELKALTTITTNFKNNVKTQEDAESFFESIGEDGNLLVDSYPELFTKLVSEVTSPTEITTPAAQRETDLSWEQNGELFNDRIRMQPDAKGIKLLNSSNNEGIIGKGKITARILDGYDKPIYVVTNKDGVKLGAVSVKNLNETDKALLKSLKVDESIDIEITGKDFIRTNDFNYIADKPENISKFFASNTEYDNSDKLPILERGNKKLNSPIILTFTQNEEGIISSHYLSESGSLKNDTGLLTSKGEVVYLGTIIKDFKEKVNKPGSGIKTGDNYMIIRNIEGNYSIITLKGVPLGNRAEALYNEIVKEFKNTPVSEEGKKELSKYLSDKKSLVNLNEFNSKTSRGVSFSVIEENGKYVPGVILNNESVKDWNDVIDGDLTVVGNTLEITDPKQIKEYLEKKFTSIDINSFNNANYLSNLITDGQLLTTLSPKFPQGAVGVKFNIPVAKPVENVVAPVAEPETTTESSTEAIVATTDNDNAEAIAELENEKQKELTTLKVGDSYNVISSTGSYDGTWKVVEITDKFYRLIDETGAKLNIDKARVEKNLKKPEGLSETRYIKSNADKIIAEYNAKIEALKTATESKPEKSGDYEDAGELFGDPAKRTSTPKFKVWNKQTELDWKNRVLPQIPVEVHESLSALNKRFGVDAFGIFHNAVIHLAEGTAEGTTYHEAFHAVFRLYLSENERVKILNQLRKEGLVGTDLELEEILAERFREYVETGKEKKSILKTFFDKLVVLIKNAFGLSNYKDLFDKIEAGEFANLPIERSTANFAPAPRLINPELSFEKQKKYTDALANAIYNKLLNLQKKSTIVEVDFNNITTKNILDIRSELKEMITSTYEKRPNNIVAKNLSNNFDAFFKDGLSKFSDLIGVSLSNDSLDLTNPDIELSNSNSDRIYDKNAFEEDPAKSLDKKVKAFLATMIKTEVVYVDGKRTYQPKKNEINSNEFVAFEDIYNYLLVNLQGLNTYDKMLSKVQQLSELDSKQSTNLKYIYDTLTIQETSKMSPEAHTQFVNAFFTAFRNQNVEMVSNIKFSKNGSWKTIEINRNSLPKVIMNEWMDSYNPTNKSITAINEGNYAEQLHTLLTSFDLIINKEAVENYVKAVRNDKSTSNFIKDLLGVHISVGNIFKTDNINVKKGLEKLSRYQSEYYIDKTASTFLNGEGKQVYPFNRSHFAKDFFDDLFSNTSTLRDLINQDYYVNNKILGEISDAKDKGETNLKMYLFDTIHDNSKDTSEAYDDMTPTNALIHKYLMADKTATRGVFFLPTPSDRGRSAVIELPKLLGLTDNAPFDENLNFVLKGNFYNYIRAAVETEFNRIKSVKEILASGNIADANYKGYLEQGQFFNHFWWLNEIPITDNFNDFFESATPLIQDNMKILFRQLMNEFRDNGLIENKDGKVLATDKATELGLGFNKTAKYKGKDVSESIVEKIGKYFANSYQVNKDLNDLFMGDPAFYTKGEFNPKFTKEEMQTFFQTKFTEISKRAGQPFTPGTQGKFSTETFTLAVLPDKNVSSDYIKPLVAKLNNITIEQLDAILNKKVEDTTTDEKAIRALVNNYVAEVKDGKKLKDPINSTDAQGFITLSRHKDILNAQGKYEGTIKSLIDKSLAYSEKGIIEELTDEELYTALQPIKGHYFATRTETVNGKKIQVPTLIKYSAIPLLPQFVTGTAKDLYDRMNGSSSIDEVVFESGVKVGENDYYEIKDGKRKKKSKSNSDFSNLLPMTLLNKYYRIPQVVPFKDKDYTNFGSQIRKLISSYAGSNRAGYENTLRELLDLKLGNFKDADYLNNLETLIKRIKSTLEASGGGLSEDLETALEIIDGTTKVALDFPLVRNKIEKILNSIMNKELIDLTMPGISAVQVSDFMASEDLAYVKYNETTKEYEPGEVLVTPQYFINHLRKKGVTDFSQFMSGDKFDITKIPSSLLKGALYRIPTQGPKSMMPFVVKGFLNHTQGSTIILPREFLVTSGSDFDVDKVFIEFKNFDIEYNKETKLPEIKPISLKADYDYYTNDLFRSEIKEIKDKYKDELKTIFQELDELNAAFVNNKNGVNNIEISNEIKKQQKETSARLNILLKSRNDEISAFKEKEYSKAKFNANPKLTQTQLENKIINYHYSILLDPETIKAMIQPNATPKTDKTIELLKEGRKWLYDYSSHSVQEEIRQANASGKKGVSIWASNLQSNSVFEAIDAKMYMTYEVNGKKMKAPFSLNINGVKFNSLSKKTGINGVAPGVMLDEKLNYNLDGAKDPKAFYVNDNQMTASINALLTRLGTDEVVRESEYDIAALFLGNPYIKLITNRIINNQDGKKEDTIFKIINEEISKFKNEEITRLIGNQKVTPELNAAINEQTDYIRLLTDEEILDNDMLLSMDESMLILDIKNSNNLDIATKVKMLNQFYWFNKIGSDLTNVSIGLSIDGKGFQATNIENKQQLKKIKDVLGGKNEYIKVDTDKFLDTQIGKYYTNFVEGLGVVDELMTFDSSSLIAKTVEKLEKIKGDQLSEEELKTILYDGYQFILSNPNLSFYVSPERLSDLLTGDTSLAKKLIVYKNTKRKNEEFINPFIDLLNANLGKTRATKEQDEEVYSGVYFDYVEFNNTQKLSPSQIQDLKTAYMALIASSDEIDRTLAADIADYAIGTLGFSFSATSITTALPIEFFMKNGMVEYLKDTNSIARFDPRFIDQLLANNIDKFKFIPTANSVKKLNDLLQTNKYVKVKNVDKEIDGVYFRDDDNDGKITKTTILGEENKFKLYNTDSTPDKNLVSPTFNQIAVSKNPETIALSLDRFTEIFMNQGIAAVTKTDEVKTLVPMKATVSNGEVMQKSIDNVTNQLPSNEEIEILQNKLNKILFQNAVKSNEYKTSIDNSEDEFTFIKISDFEKIINKQYDLIDEYGETSLDSLYEAEFNKITKAGLSSFMDVYDVKSLLEEFYNPKLRVQDFKADILIQKQNLEKILPELSKYQRELNFSNKEKEEIFNESELKEIYDLSRYEGNGGAVAGFTLDYEGSSVGYVMIDPNYSIRYITIYPEYEGFGLATKFVNEIRKLSPEKEFSISLINNPQMFKVGERLSGIKISDTKIKLPSYNDKPISLNYEVMQKSDVAVKDNENVLSTSSENVVSSQEENDLETPCKGGINI